MPEAAIRRFVRETLGCTCPEEVFERIEDEYCAARDGLGEYRRLLVGERLLIYIVTLFEGRGSAAGWKDGLDDALEAQLCALLAAGRAERDRLGLNRFRAVLAAPEPDALAPLARRALATFHDADAKVHLHVVRRGECPAPPSCSRVSGRCVRC